MADDPNVVKLPQIEVVGKGDGVPPKGNYVDDFWGRVVEIHFGEEEEPPVWTIVTYRGQGVGDTGGGENKDVHSFIVEFSERTKNTIGGYNSPDLGNSSVPTFTVGVGTKKIPDYHGEPPAITISVEVTGYKQAVQDPNNPNDPPPPSISFERGADGALKAINGTAFYSQRAAAPNVGAVKAEILITFGPKGAS